VGDGRTQRAHGEGHHVHGAASHAAVEQRVQRGAHFGRFHPVVGGACVFLLGGADIGAVFHAGHVRRIGPGQEGAGALGQGLEGAGIHQLLAQRVIFGLRAVAPVDLGGLAQRGHFGDPGNELGVLDVVGSLDVQALHSGVHGEVLQLKTSFSKKHPPGCVFEKGF
jgi:hypothetical protein